MTTTRRRKVALAGALVGAALLAAAGAWYWFAPKPEVERSDAAPLGTLVRTGTFQDGDAFHRVSGTVRVIQTEEGAVLRFEGYDATSGPDVFAYLTPKPRATSAHEVEAQGVRILAPTTTGQATLRGDFNLDVPDGVDVTAYGGVAIWCERFDVLFGYAELGGA